MTDPRTIVVVGPWGGGTSAVAGVLHHLGVSMGSNLYRVPWANHGRQRNTFEDADLRKILRREIREPGYCEPHEEWQLSRKYCHLAIQLAGWRIRRVRSGDVLIGAKHPLLCSLYALSMIRAEWKPLTFVRVRRDPGSVAATAARRAKIAKSWQWKGPTTIADVNAMLDEGLEDHEDVVDVSFEELVANPMATIDTKIVAPLGLLVSDRQTRAAAAFVVPER